MTHTLEDNQELLGLKSDLEKKTSTKTSKPAKTSKSSKKKATNVSDAEKQLAELQKKIKDAEEKLKDIEKKSSEAEKIIANAEAAIEYSAQAVAKNNNKMVKSVTDAKETIKEMMKNAGEQAQAIIDEAEAKASSIKPKAPAKTAEVSAKSSSSEKASKKSESSLTPQNSAFVNMVKLLNNSKIQEALRSDGMDQGTNESELWEIINKVYFIARSNGDITSSKPFSFTDPRFPGYSISTAEAAVIASSKGAQLLATAGTILMFDNLEDELPSTKLIEHIAGVALQMEEVTKYILGSNHKLFSENKLKDGVLNDESLSILAGIRKEYEEKCSELSDTEHAVKDIVALRYGKDLENEDVEKYSKIYKACKHTMQNMINFANSVINTGKICNWDRAMLMSGWTPDELEQVSPLVDELVNL